MAIRQEDLPWVADLIASGIDVDAKGLARKATPLGLATELGMLDIARALLAAGAAPCAQRHNELPPLMTAARHPDAALLEALARASADATARTRETPLNLAAGGQEAATALLLSFGDDMGMHAEQRAAKAGNPKAHRWLSELRGIRADAAQGPDLPSGAWRPRLSGRARQTHLRRARLREALLGSCNWPEPYGWPTMAGWAAK